jgi:GST-like protein
MKLYAIPGWGSAIVEAQLAFYGLPHAIEDIGDVFQSEGARARIRGANPLTQVPTLVLEDGRVMTESAAITLWLADVAGSDALVPGPADPARAQFLRWLVFLVANIYPCFTFADVPERFVEVEAARAPFRRAVDSHLKRLWELAEEAAGAPWFLGDRLSAIDVYFGVMTRWRPRGWFPDHAPRVWASAEAARAHPRMAAAFTRNAELPAPPSAGPAGG